MQRKKITFVVVDVVATTTSVPKVQLHLMSQLILTTELNKNTRVGTLCKKSVEIVYIGSVHYYFTINVYGECILGLKTSFWIGKI
jgi:hypothetical protein